MTFCRRDFRRIVLFVLLMASSRFAVPAKAVEPTWSVGRSISIRVNEGRAEADIPCRQQSSKTLVIVSALTTKPGPFAVSLSAMARDSAQRVETVDDGPTRVIVVPPQFSLPAPTPSVVSPPSVRAFHLLVRDGDPASLSNYDRVEAKLAAVGVHIQVYVDPADLGLVQMATLREIVETFDQKIFPIAKAELGLARDVDGDGRFTVLVSSLLSRLAGGKTQVDGFVRGTDFDLQMNGPYGNRCDMMYLAARLEPGPHLKTVLAHEYTHAISFSRKALADDGTRVCAEEEGWLDEAMAHLVEDRHGFSRSNLDYRVSAFLSRPERYRLVVEDYYAENLFRGHGNRGGTYLFLRWCVDTYGPELIGRLIGSKRRGIASLEDATGSTFASLYRRWSVALYVSGLGLVDSELCEFRSIDLREGDEDWTLAGPRSSFVTPGGDSDEWQANGTTSHYAVVGGSATGFTRIKIMGPDSAQLQVTLVPLPDDLARLDLSIKPSISSTQQVRARVRVAERSGSSVRLSALAWEPLVPASDPRSASFRRSGLDMLGLAASFGTSALPASGFLASKPIPLPGVTPGLGPLVFKVIGTDAKGRRVAGWAEVDLPGRDGMR